ncbi:metal ABC transporter permease [Pseudonocardia sp. WMMC193]|uniref:metal ABC transporter permease n=1 Tax=Pseudonocardia sp. WMMC193 TaxID=2911965 RepID=UPI001F184F88|nr:iron chelate uptake ABC transporter family permease subunit [Pseudonocardia sp. WMMC193]MCF7551406.1 metal ABC transporter permease [Pseudonocardia sp. WMMC193]
MDRLSALLGLPYTDTVVVAGALVLGISAGVLGSFAVLRGRSLVGDAIAHATLPGVCVAFLVTGTKEIAGLLAGAAVAGLVAALLMVAVERSVLRADTAIGVVLSGFFSLGIVLLTHITATGDAQQAGLEAFLFGQAAGLLERDVAVMGLLGAVGLLAVLLLRRMLVTTLFDRAYAAAIGAPTRLVEVAVTAFLVAAVVIGVRLVGAILMVAMLAVPTVVARQLADSFGRVLVLAGIVGAVVGVAGALLATRAQLPTGPVVVLVGVAVAVLAVLLAPRRGVLARRARLTRRRRRMERDRLLLAGGTSRRLVRANLMTPDGVLTVAGERARREAQDRDELWRAWLRYGPQIRLRDAREPDLHDLRRTLAPEALAELERLAR